MQRSTSFGTSWADQWDYGGDPSPRASRDHLGKSGGVGEKTKVAAASGLRKVKDGTAQGFQWIKDKCQRKNSGGGKKQKQKQSSEVAGC
ncbi:uncharacterized protein LOC133925840 [Phragmites australis]|uniref:uncharacterized protein LOC133925840 n=1 Tax=Phragmites australis TaxID=29695 RepID=UPI002D769304|nr:uncharacterized protein LOC133925840 [Phragmites australis]